MKSICPSPVKSRPCPLRPFERPVTDVSRFPSPLISILSGVLSKRSMKPFTVSEKRSSGLVKRLASATNV